ncbi:hypothetical protein R9C00_29255 [Flammeovirgaceae bacterium SG7u.111]|nr:hypothetical protein [Flammeovirgaceae bacterium SG7u.132]WPO35788.1 hypothetical protein R9C00_29255 [Flammeovirgaceae bacterium SG7u.111]
MKKFKILLITQFLLWLTLPGCDLGNFEPFDLFEREELESYPFTLNADNNCDITFYVNQNRIAISKGSSQIKGSLYFKDSEGDIVYFTNGDFDVVTDSDSSFSSMSGYAIANFPQTGIFSNIINETESGANMELNQGIMFSNPDSLPLSDSQCYMHAVVDGGFATLTTEEGTFRFDEYYVAFDDPFIAYSGDISLRYVEVEGGKFAISYSGLIPFEPSNQLDVFENFRGHLYVDGSLPFTVENMSFLNEGTAVIDATPQGSEDAQAFFDGTSETFQQGTNGTLTYGYELLDTILNTHGYYADADKSLRQGKQVTLATSTSVWTKQDQIQHIDFTGIYADTFDLYQETLLDHPILENLKYKESDSVAIQGSYGNNVQLWVYSISSNADLELEGITTANFTEAILSTTFDEIEFSGLYESPFEFIPSMLLAGEISNEGNILLEGKTTQAVLIGSETYFVTYFMTMKITDGTPEVNITAEAKTCITGNCPAIPVDVEFDYSTEDSKLCINAGADCTN